MTPKFYFPILIAVLTVTLPGCQSMSSSKARQGSKSESSEEVIRAVGSVTGALAGKEMDDREARQLVENLRKDKEARSALESISGALEVRQTAIKYCPVDGKRFSSDVNDCPEHKVKLKELVD